MAENATIANTPGTAPNATFLVNSPLNFSLDDSGTQTVSAFLMSGGAFAIAAPNPADLTSAGNNTFWRFEGAVSVTNNQRFDVRHDDGVTPVIGGLAVINTPGPTPPVVTSVTCAGATGNLPLVLVYAECCGGPAVLDINLPLVTPGAVPVPAALAPFGVGLLGLARHRG